VQKAFLYGQRKEKREKRKEERSERDREEREVVKDWYIVLATGVSHSVAHHA